MKMFRDLRAEEIECRVAQAKEKGVSLLLYKDARCDQNILDETVGAMNWQRHHNRDNANCVVSIWDEKKSQWIEKEDTGTESNTEKEKGLASDSFKRACFNWGIGRELYTAPFIWVNAGDCKRLEIDSRSGKWKCFDSFEVSDISIKDKHIVGITIKNCKTGKVVFTMGKQIEEPRVDDAPSFKRVEPIHTCSVCGKPVTPIEKNGKVQKSTAEVVAWTQETFGKTYCWNCAKKEMDSREGQ